MDYSLPRSVHGISQARILEWVAISTSRGSSWLRNWTHISCGSWVGRWILYPRWTFPFQNTEIWNSSGSFLFLSLPPLECLQDLKLLGISPHFVYCIRDAIQPSHPLMTISPSALNLSQHQGLFQWAGCWHQMTKILEFQLQHQSFQWAFRVDFPEKIFLNIDTYLTKNIFFLHESQVLTNRTGSTWRKPFLLHCYSATCGNKSLIAFLLILDLKWNLFLFDVFFSLILSIRENHHQNKFSVSSRLK